MLEENKNNNFPKIGKELYELKRLQTDIVPMSHDA